MVCRNFVLIPLPPATANVSAVSSKIVDANINRTSISIINISVNPVFLSFGNNPAIVNGGIAILPEGGTFLMDNNTVSILEINAISTGDAMVAIQEFN
jgi:hypothetical protein